MDIINMNDVNFASDLHEPTECQKICCETYGKDYKGEPCFGNTAVVADICDDAGDCGACQGNFFCCPVDCSKLIY